MDSTSSDLPTIHAQSGTLTRGQFFMPDGTLIASGGADKTVPVWKPDGLPIFIYRGYTNTVSGLTCSTDGALIVSASQDSTVQVWSAIDSSKSFTYSGHSAAVNAVTWLPNPGQEVASASSNVTVQIWQGE